MRSPGSIRGRRAGGERREGDGNRDEQSAGGGRLRTVLLAATLLGLGYLLWRRMRSGPPASGPGERDTGGVGLEEGHPITIDGPTDEGTSAEQPEETASAVDPSLEEVDERVEADVGEAPAEPGGVTVSEDVAEEAGEEGTADEADQGTVEESGEDGSDAESAEESSEEETADEQGDEAADETDEESADVPDETEE